MTIRASLPGRALGVCLFLALPLLGCQGPTAHVASPPSFVDRPDPPLPTNGIDHIIPLRFVEMVDHCNGPCQPTIASLETLHTRAAEASAVFHEAGIQFVVERVDVYPMPSFFDLLDDTAKHPNGNRDRTFGEIKAEIGQALPMPGCTSPGPKCPWRDDEVRKERQWLVEVAIFFQPSWETLVWVAGTNNGSQGQMPWDGRSITTNAIDLTYSNLSHEIGHYLGLPHVFNGLYDSDLTNRLTLNPATRRPLRLSDFWDLVYRPGDPPRSYRSREEAARDEPYLVTKNDQTMSTGALNCKVSDDRACMTTCQVLSSNGQRHPVTSDDPLLAGLAFQFPDHRPDHPSRGYNVMSYIGSAHCAGFGITTSQVLQVRRVMMYDIPNLYFPQIMGGRPDLGRRPAG